MYFSTGPQRMSLGLCLACDEELKWAAPRGAAHAWWQAESATLGYLSVLPGKMVYPSQTLSRTYTACGGDLGAAATHAKLLCACAYAFISMHMFIVVFVRFFHPSCLSQAEADSPSPCAVQSFDLEVCPNYATAW
jgi:hypothetical protein